MLKLENLTKAFEGRTVLAGLSYSFPERGSFALMSPSGTGKTTLLRLCCGLEKPDGGSVENTYKKTAVAFQEPRLLPWLTAKQNLLPILPRETAEKDAERWLVAVGLADAADLYPAELSGGMRGRLSLARALAFGGDLLLLDEPFTGLDEALTEQMAELIKAANPTGLTLTVTHSEKEAALLGATVLRLTGEPITAIEPTQVE